MLYTIGIAACVVVLLAAVGAYCLTKRQRRSPFTDHTIASVTTISTEWLEITPEKPLKPEKDEQQVGLYLEGPFSSPLDAPDGVRVADASVVTPEVELVDTEGNVIRLEWSGTRGTRILSFGLLKKLGGREYRTVRIRADKPIKCKEILWTNIEWKYLS